MLKKSIEAQFGYLDMVHTVTKKAVAAIPEDKLDFRPTPAMRSAKEIVLHIYGGTKAMADSALSLEMPEAAYKAAEDASNAPNKAALLDYMDACQKRLNEVVSGLTEEDLQKTVKCFYGDSKVDQHLRFVYDEHWHHRGQLYAYLRLMDIEPPFLYGYE